MHLNDPSYKSLIHVSSALLVVILSWCLFVTIHQGTSVFNKRTYIGHQLFNQAAPTFHRDQTSLATYFSLYIKRALTISIGREQLAGLSTKIMTAKNSQLSQFLANHSWIKKRHDQVVRGLQYYNTLTWSEADHISLVGLLLFFFASTLLLTHKADKHWWLHTWLLQAGLLLGLGIFLAALAIMYILVYGKDPTVKNNFPSLARYLSSYCLAWFFVNLGIAVKAFNQGRRLRALCVLTCLLMLGFLYAPADGIQARPNPPLLDDTTKMTELVVRHVHPNDKTYLVWQYNTIYPILILRYNLLPTYKVSINGYWSFPDASTHVTKDQFLSLLADYKYLLIANPDQAFYEQFGRFITLKEVEKITLSASNTQAILYEIQHTT